MAVNIKKNYLQSYEKLVKIFPLRPIRSEAENDEATKLCDMLTDRLSELTRAEADYLEVLTDLIAKFESRWDNDTNDMSARQLIQYLMDQNDLNQSDLVTELGSPSRVSEFLSGKRNLSLEQAKKLAARFKLNLTALIAT